MIPQAPGRGAGADAGRAAVGFSQSAFSPRSLPPSVRVLLIAGANYFLDPLHFSAPARDRSQPAALRRNYAVFRREHGFSRLRREANRADDNGRRTSSCSEAAVSSWRHRIFFRRTFYNGFVHNDVFEDLVAFSGLLYEHKRLRKTSF